MLLYVVDSMAYVTFMANKGSICLRYSEGKKGGGLCGWMEHLQAGDT